MSEPLPLIDGDLRQVLEDLSRDPKAHLFLAEPAKLLTGLRDGSLLARPSRTGLQPVERHLLQVHRHEVAWLLRDAFLRSFAQEVSTKNVFVPGHPLSAADYRAAVDRMLGHIPKDLLARPEVRVLRNSARPRTEDALPTNLGLLAASLTLEDAENARTYVGYDMQRCNQPRSALRATAGALERSSDPEIRLRVSQLRGLCYLDLAEYALCARAYMRACRWAESVADPAVALAESLLNLAAAALHAGNYEETRAAASRVERLSLPDTEMAAIITRVSLSWSSVPFPAFNKHAAAALRGCGPTTKRIFDAVP